MAGKSVCRYDKNPFVSDLWIPMKDKNLQVSRFGKDRNILVNKNTGECFITHVVAHKRVDTEQFIKLFTSNVASMFELSSPGIKALSVLIWSMQEKSLNKDLVPLDNIVREEFIKSHSKEKEIKLSAPTFARGLSELEKAKIIAKYLRQGWYFINPSFVFNGDRIIFSTVITKDKYKSTNEDQAVQKEESHQENEDTKTKDLFEK